MTLAAKEDYWTLDYFFSSEQFGGCKIKTTRLLSSLIYHHVFHLCVRRFAEGLEAPVQNQSLCDITQEEAELSQHMLLVRHRL